MKAEIARKQMNKIKAELDELSKIENPTDRDWSRVIEQYQQFIDRLDEWDNDPLEFNPIGLTDKELDRLADNLVERMHT